MAVLAVCHTSVREFNEEICAEVGSQMIGGTDTTSITLSYTAWELAKQPVLQDKVRQELREAMT